MRSGANPSAAWVCASDLSEASYPTQGPRVSLTTVGLEPQVRAAAFDPSKLSHLGAGLPVSRAVQPHPDALTDTGRKLERTSVASHAAPQPVSVSASEALLAARKAWEQRQHQLQLEVWPA